MTVDSTWIDLALDRAERLLERAGVARWELCAEEVASAAVEVIDGEVEVVERSIERAVGVRVLDGGIGFAGLTEPEDDELADAIQVALREAKTAREAKIDDFASSAGRVREVSERFYDGRASGATRKLLIESALALEALVLAADKRIDRVRPARIDEEAGIFGIRTSAGLDIRERHSRASAVAGAVAESDDDTQSSYASVSASCAELLVLAEVAREAAGSAAALLGADTFETKRVPVIFGFDASAELIALLAGGLDAERIERGASFFGGALGRTMVSPALTLVDDPHDGTLDGAVTFDGEGLKTGPATLIECGTVRAVLDDRESALRAGRTPNARAVRSSARDRPSPGAHNLALQPGEQTLAELLVLAEGGVYVHEVSGTHTMNEVTGELSLGAVGWAIRSGGKAEPITGLTVSGTLLDMLSGSIALSSEVRLLGSIRAPAILIESAQVSA